MLYFDMEWKKKISLPLSRVDVGTRILLSAAKVLVSMRQIRVEYTSLPYVYLYIIIAISVTEPKTY